MSSGERQHEIMRILLSRRFETMKRIAVEIGASYKTIRRDVLELAARYPLETIPGKHGGVRLSAEYSPYKNLFTREHKQALVKAAATADEDTARLLGEILMLIG